MINKIEKAIKEGKLISHEEVMAQLPAERRKRIEERAKYLRISMELRSLRRRLRLSQNKLAMKMKVKREFISRLESGEQNVTLETLFKIAEATGKEFHFSFR